MVSYEKHLDYLKKALKKNNASGYIIGKKQIGKNCLFQEDNKWVVSSLLNGLENERHEYDIDDIWQACEDIISRIANNEDHRRKIWTDWASPLNWEEKMDEPIVAREVKVSAKTENRLVIKCKKTRTYKRSTLVGRKIKYIRESLFFTKEELGERTAVLDADRIRLYECGILRPNQEIIKIIAKALNVNPIVFNDTDVKNPINAMFTFFEMERAYHLHPIVINGKVYLSSFDDRLNDYLYMWVEKYNDYINNSLSSMSAKKSKKGQIEYNLWRYNFPNFNSNDIEKILIKEEIALLQEKLKELGE